MRFSSVSQKRFDPRHSPNRPRTNFYPIKRYLMRQKKMRKCACQQIFMGVGLLQGGVLTGKSHIASSSEMAKIACYTLCKTLQCSGTVLKVLLRCLQPKLVLVFGIRSGVRSAGGGGGGSSRRSVKYEVSATICNHGYSPQNLRLLTICCLRSASRAPSRSNRTKLFDINNHTQYYPIRNKSPPLKRR